MTKEPIVIVAAKRTPIGAFQGIFQEVSTTKLGAVAILGVIEETFLRDVDEVIMGCALPAALGQAPARQASIGSGLGHHVGATTINKICGSGMKSVMLAHDLLQAGNGKVIIAGGMENMTRSPYLLDKARSGYRLGHGHLIDHMYFDGLEDAYDKRVLMGAFAEACAAHFKFTREEQDKFTLESVMRAKNAVSSGGFSGEISSVTIEKRVFDN
jgi:acetyl-CoA C-acetyltransferase